MWPSSSVGFEIGDVAPLPSKYGQSPASATKPGYPLSGAGPGARSRSMRVSMSATGSVSTSYVCFSLSHPFAPEPVLSLRRTRGSLLLRSLALGRWSSASPFQFFGLGQRANDKSTAGMLPSYHDDFATPGISPAQRPARGSTSGKCRTCAETPAVAPARAWQLGCACAGWKTSASAPWRRAPSETPPESLRPSLVLLSSFGPQNSLPPDAPMKLLLRPERHAQMLQQRARLIVVIRLGRGHDRDVHCPSACRPSRRKSPGKINCSRCRPSVKLPRPSNDFGRDSLEITHPRAARYSDQPVTEIRTWPIAAQRDHGSDRLAFAHLEGGNQISLAP